MQITSFTIVYSTVYSGRSKKTPKLCVTGLCVGNSLVTGEFPTQRANNMENVPIWWCHHIQTTKTVIISLYLQATWSKNDISLVHEISFIYLNFLSLRPRKVGTNVTMMRTIEVFNCMKRVEFQSQNVGICSNWYNRGCIYGFIDTVQLARVMAWCLTAPRHYLNQCGFLISGVLCHSPESNQVYNNGCLSRDAYPVCGPCFNLLRVAI